jgi:hypothetical protein
MTKRKSQAKKRVKNLKREMEGIIYKIRNFHSRKVIVCKNNNHKIRNTNGECIKCSYVREGHREEDFIKNFPKYYKKDQ